ncbi:MAG: molybdopterin-dependent oxidoreductase [Nitrososphaerota archaeon]
MLLEEDKIFLPDPPLTNAPLKEADPETIKKIKEEINEERIEYLPGALCGFAVSSLPMEVHVRNKKIVRITPLHIPENVKLYEIKTKRGTFTRPRKHTPHAYMLAWKKRIYSPNRVKYPLKRVDWSPENRNPQNRGKSGFIRISWEEAIDTIVKEIKRQLQVYGTLETVLVQADGHGQSGFLHTIHFYGHYFFDKIGYGWTHQVRNPDSWEGYYWGAKLAWGFDGTVGEPTQDAVWDDILNNAEIVIMSGCDPETTTTGFSGFHTHMLFWLKQAGIKTIWIEPGLNYSAAVFADRWIPVNPGTDGALYLAIAYVWIKENLYDEEYVKTHTVGFEEFKKHVLGEDDGIPKTPEWASKITGIPSHTIKALARLWAKKRTSLGVHFGGGKVRGKFSQVPARFEAYVLAMQGLGKPGRQFFRFWMGPLSSKMLSPLPRYPDVNVESVPENFVFPYAIMPPTIGVPLIKTLVPDAILNPPVKWKCVGSIVAPREDLFTEYRYPPRDDHPGIRMIWNENSCWSVCWVNGYRFLEAMRSPKIEFIVAIHPWLENDVLFADIVLPALTDEEVADLTPANCSDMYALAYHEPCVERVGESKSDYEIHREIALRLAKELNKPELAEAFPEPEKVLEDAYKRTIAYTKLKITWEEFKKKKIVIYDAPTWEEWVKIKKEKLGLEETEGGLAWFYKTATGLETPTGKIEFASEDIKKYAPDDKERPPVQKWIEHDELPTSERAKKYKFLLITNHVRWRHHSQGDDISWIREIPTCKVKGPDGYLYEPAWINPEDAKELGIQHGDVVKIYNERGAVLCGAYVTWRVPKGVIWVDHGSRIDLLSLEDKIDRGGSTNLICPSPVEKYKPGETINIPEMCVTGYLVGVEKVDIFELLKRYPEAAAKKYHPGVGHTLETYCVRC